MQYNKHGIPVAVKPKKKKTGKYAEFVRNENGNEVKIVVMDYSIQQMRAQGWQFKGFSKGEIA